MKSQFSTWYTLPDCNTVMIRNGGDLFSILTAGIIPYQGRRLVHRSKLLSVPSDDRFVRHRGSVIRPYPQGWHTNWQGWVRSFLVEPFGPDEARFLICVLIESKRELQVCGQPRTVNQGTFALQLTREDRSLFLLAEERVLIYSKGILPALIETDKEAQKIDRPFDLY